MKETRNDWIDLAHKRPQAGQFVRVEVSEKVQNHRLEFEGQARFDPESGWLTADGELYLKDGQEILRWKPLFDSSGHEEWDDFVGDLAKD